MCAIAGLLCLDGNQVDEATLARMSKRMAHRGPDGAAMYVGRSVGLAHRRLSILDLTDAARQPMWDADHTAAICYNGEIYNYKELRQQLGDQGHTFRSTGDTEVLLTACRAWGVVEAARRANGMFAFAYWDDRHQELWLARDRLGIKPLYYHHTPQRVLFASEIKALLGEVEPEPDERALAGLLMRVPLYGPHTLFRGICSLEAGHAVCIRPDGRWQSQTFFSLHEAVNADLYQSLDRMTDDQVVSRLAEHLDHSTLLHLASDAGVATLLSGGLDSSLVSCLARKHLPQLSAYHADVQGPLSELSWARELAQNADMPLHVATLTPELYVRTLADVTYANEMPVCLHPNTVPFYLICRAAADHGVKVLLTGEGPDELFGGYPVFCSNMRRRRLEVWKGRAQHVLSTLRLARLGRLLDWLSGPPTPDALRSPVAALTTRGNSLLPLRQAQEAYGFIADPIEREFQADLFAYLHGYLQSILWRNDRMGMAVGIESRVPYLENEIIRLAVNLPMRFKFRGGAGKWALRRAAERHVPRPIVRRPKFGFPVDARHYVRPSPEFFNDGFVADTLGIGPRQLTAISDDHPELYFAMVTTEIWGQLFLRRAEPPAVAEHLLRSVVYEEFRTGGGPKTTCTMVNRQPLVALRKAS